MNRLTMMNEMNREQNDVYASILVTVHNAVRLEGSDKSSISDSHTLRYQRLLKGLLLAVCRRRECNCKYNNTTTTTATQLHNCTTADY